MDDTMGNEGINRLAGVLQGRMSQMGDKPQVLDFGVIQGDMSLLTNRFPKPIPQKDYMVCRQVTLGPTHNILAKTQDIGMPHSGSHIHKTHDLTCDHHGGKVTGTTGEATSAAPDPPIPSARTAGGDSADGMHQHHVLIPEKMRSIKPGDRVLVAWVGDDAVVVDLVLPATAV
ncbi:hypothetical protein D1157_08130 [Anaerotruncus sp. X29]|jgi:hypothetical protein|nr:hypothetical protein [Anaerotruncus sp. X29]